MGSIFDKKLNVDITSDEGKDFDDVVAQLKNIEREQILLRKGNEIFDWENEVEEHEDIDLDEIPVREDV